MEAFTAALKVFVVAAGILLVGGTLALGYMLWQRAATPDPVSTPTAEIAPAAEPGTVVLPAGSRIVQVAAEGGRLTLLIEGQFGVQFVATVDPRTGRQLGLLRAVRQ
ncbi:hypothetical protein [Marinivivus vitaminiproducens]|uniref:hypothetical protein n=1 Tax=Marinivivus vitaminiproducens TaxID=3035935 RepID=UPI0027A05837|nr:hypothetical protein P4R82_03655 [Geminicoccaceae bacterium SCSIO 64248]